MKKLLTFLGLAFILTLTFSLTFPDEAHAQLIKTVTPTTAKDSLVNAESITILLPVTSNDVAGFHVTGTRATGTIAGTVIFQGSLDGTNWAPVDTVTLTNLAYMIASLESPYQLPFARYRAIVTTSGTVKVTGIRGHILRRSR